MKNFKQFIEEQKEVEIDGYKTKYHYMCPSAVKFFNKHDRMDHSEDEAKALSILKQAEAHTGDYSIFDAPEQAYTVLRGN